MPKADVPEAGKPEADMPAGSAIGDIPGLAAGNLTGKDEPDPGAGFTQPLVDVSGPSAKLPEMGDVAPPAGGPVDMSLPSDPLKAATIPSMAVPSSSVPGTDALPTLPGEVPVDVQLPGAAPGEISAPPLGTIEDLSAPTLPGADVSAPDAPSVDATVPTADVSAPGVDASLDKPGEPEANLPGASLAAGAAAATAAAAGVGAAAGSNLPSAPGVGTPDASPAKSKKSKLPSIGGFFKRKGSKKSIGEEGSLSGAALTFCSTHPAAVRLQQLATRTVDHCLPCAFLFRLSHVRLLLSVATCNVGG